MGPKSGSGLLQAVAGVQQKKNRAIKFHGHGHRRFPAQFSCPHEFPEEVGLKPETVVPVQAAVDLPAALILKLTDQQQPAEADISLRNVLDEKEGNRLILAGQLNLDRTLWGVLYGSARYFRYLGMAWSWKYSCARWKQASTMASKIARLLAKWL